MNNKITKGYLIELLDKYENSKAATAQTELSYQMFKYYLNKYNIVTNSRKASRIKALSLNKEEVIKKYIELKSAKKTSVYFGIGKDAILDIIPEYLKDSNKCINLIATKSFSKQITSKVFIRLDL